MTRRALALSCVLALAAGASSCTAATDPEPAPGSAPARDIAPASARVEIEMGHCFVEPVAFDGEEWNVRFSDQFGWGGLEPRRWQGRGVMVRVDADRAVFADRGGATVEFRPVSHPSVRRVETALCA